MATTAYRQHYALPREGTLPISMPRKATHDTYQGRSMAMSPPEGSDYASSRSGPSYSAGSSTYAGSSSGDLEPSSSASYSGVDVLDTLSDRMNRAFDPITMDKGLARQAQSSGQLNAKQRELLELQAAAQRRMKSSRVRYAAGLQAAKETRSDLDYIRSQVPATKAQAERKYPDAYAQARKKYGS
ncbi:hypothetical protein UCRPC4_g05370 [Phaeomoniella chlamydospora]|uniref:Biogenesis of lysosome-related organelles complex 1 subunit KXD1 n=1 Tax=Phaeomoniella chlamydospora TaxID=158046 RepID=A0A0G2E3U8_PHACM|nr:hypothetical protein UCRPC4_g05370 [Phaeomoniella chlamydospora]